MRWSIILVVSGSFLLGLICSAPAAKVLPRALGPGSGIQAYEISGPLLGGHIGYLDTGRLQLENIKWRIRPWMLLRARFSADVEAASPGGAKLAGRVNKGLGSTTLLTDLRLSTSVDALKPLLRLPFVPITGQISAEFESLRLQGRVPVAAKGQLRLGNAQWALSRPPADLGDFAADIQTQDQVIISTFQDQAAKLAVNGELRLEPDGAYALNAKLKARADTPAAVNNNLKTLGRTDREGWYSLKYSGQLPQ